MKRLEITVKLISIVIGIVSLTYIGLLLTEKSPVYYTNAPFPISEQKNYKVGDTLRFEVGRCVRKPATFTLTRTIINTDPSSTFQEYPLQSDSVTADYVGCRNVLGLPIVIPSVLPTGTYYVKHGIFVDGTYRSFHLTIDSQTFKVVNEKPDPYVIPSVIFIPAVASAANSSTPSVVNNNTYPTYGGTTVIQPQNQPVVTPIITPTIPPITTPNILPVITPKIIAPITNLIHKIL